MSKFQEFLSKRDIKGYTEEVEIPGTPYKFKIRAIDQSENKILKKASAKTYTDKKSGQRITETDVDTYNTKLIAACCVDPNFKDAEWQRENGVAGAEELIEGVLLPGEYINLIVEIQRICGFDTNVNDSIGDAKN